jgi:hypothetical protein
LIFLRLFVLFVATESLVFGCSRSKGISQLRLELTITIRNLSCLLLAILFAGCAKSGTDVAPVSGRVTLDGQPLEFAILTFQPEGKSPASGRTDKDGHYELLYKRGVMGAPVGKNKVSILLDVDLAHRPQIIPSRYNSPTELEREVTPSPNVIDFDLKTAAK